MTTRSSKFSQIELGVQVPPLKWTSPSAALYNAEILSDVAKHLKEGEIATIPILQHYKELILSRDEVQDQAAVVSFRKQCHISTGADKGIRLFN